MTTQMLGSDGRLARPHLAALRALLNNPKLPAADRAVLLGKALPAYRTWRAELSRLTRQAGPVRLDQAGRTLLLEQLVAATNTYKRVLELDVIYDSGGQFLPRQTGQLKVLSTVLEELCAALVVPGLVGLAVDGVSAGPHRALAGMTLGAHGMSVVTKDQDFALARRLELTVADRQPGSCVQQVSVFVPMVTAECKTNLDATMFTGACATAAAVQAVAPQAVSFLVCEWLDMTVRPTAGTAIANVLVLRGRRPHQQGRFPSLDAATRPAHRADYATFLDAHPLRAAPLMRLVDAVAAALAPALAADPVELGWF